jgi:16S rRNA (uracil1498-N3)-methyltransferase
VTLTPDGSAGGDLTGAEGPHTLVADVDRPVLEERDRHHLERVLRLRSGSPMTVGDGAGRWRTCTFAAELEPLSEVRSVARPEPALTIGFALIKSGRPELVVQKLTELGIDRIVPFVAGRSVVRWNGDKAANNLARLRRVAREAVMQCRRAWLPEVAPLAAFETMAAGDAVLADPTGRELGELDRTVLIGPEGGWTDEEVAASDDLVVLADHVLRAETAAIAAATLMVARRRGF